MVNISYWVSAEFCYWLGDWQSWGIPWRFLVPPDAWWNNGLKRVTTASFLINRSQSFRTIWWHGPRFINKTTGNKIFRRVSAGEVFWRRYLKEIHSQNEYSKDLLEFFSVRWSQETYTRRVGVLFLIPVVKHNGFPIPFRIGIGYVLLMLYSSARGVTSNNPVAHGNGKLMTSSDDVKRQLYIIGNCGPPLRVTVAVDAGGSEGFAARS